MKVLAILLLVLIIIIDVMAVFDLVKSQNRNKIIWLFIILLLPAEGAILYFKHKKSMR